MNDRDLPNKPLVEAFAEWKWVPSGFGIGESTKPEPWSDPGYPLYSGILYGALRSKFPFIEEQPAKQIPDAMTPGIVKMRFRESEEQWPLVQVGPGILAVNFTTTYKWETFRETAEEVFSQFASAYQQSGANLKLTIATLRYVDAIHIDAHTDVLNFAREQLHIGLDLPHDIVQFSEGNAEPLSALDLRISIPLREPRGVGNLRIANGKHGETPAIICETSVVSSEEGVPQSPNEVLSWLDQAHEVTRAWFKTLVDGELMESFRRPS